MYVALNVNTLMPQKVIETNATKHDGSIGEGLINIECILVEDRAYGKKDMIDLKLLINLLLYELRIM